jgi:cytochrome P450
MGYDFGTLQNPNNEHSEQYRKMFLEPTNAFNWLELLGNYIDFRVLLKMPVKKTLELTEGSEHIRGIAREVIRHKLNSSADSKGENKDIISVALASGAFTEEALVDHVMTFLVAGHESTATAYEWAMFEIGCRPQMQSRLRDEIRTHIPRLNGPRDIDLTRTIDSLPFLNAVCSEVLRFYPFVPFGTRVASKDGKVLGTVVPKGTIIAYAAHATNHDKSLWGPDADQFDPERWMQPKQAKSGGASSNFASLTFSAGSKNCIGQG